MLAKSDPGLETAAATSSIESILTSLREYEQTLAESLLKRETGPILGTSSPSVDEVKNENDLVNGDASEGAADIQQFVLNGESTSSPSFGDDHALVGKLENGEVDPPEPEQLSDLIFSIDSTTKALENFLQSRRRNNGAATSTATTNQTVAHSSGESGSEESISDDCEDVDANDTPQNREDDNDATGGAQPESAKSGENEDNTESRGKFGCPKCSTMYNQEHSLRRHLKKKHSLNAASFCVKCTTCEKIFKKEKFARHLQSKHCELYFKCLNCDKIFVSESSLKSHEKKEHDISGFVCTLCSRNTRKKSTRTPSINAQSVTLHLKPTRTFHLTLKKNIWTKRSAMSAKKLLATTEI